MESSATARNPTKWVLTHDHGMHPLDRAEEVWRYRRLIWFFFRETFQTLYARTQLGWVWVVIRPLAPLLVGTIVYGRLMNIQSGDVPYFLLLLSGTIAWNCFDGPWLWGSRGFELNRHIVTKIYFPRVILPLSTTSPGLAEPGVGLCVLLVAFAYYRVTRGVWYVGSASGLLVAPLCLAAILVFSFALSLWTVNWQVRARDVRYMIGYVLGFWMYLTPVIYPVTQVPESLRWAMWLNPMAPLVVLFRAAVIGGAPPPEWSLFVAVGVIATTLAAGLWYFHAIESTMADKI